MKEIELKITLTSIIMFLIGIINYGAYNVLVNKQPFITFEVMADGAMVALIYLFLIWVNSRRHQKLTILGIVYMLIIFLYLYSNKMEVTLSESVVNWKAIYLVGYCIISFEISSYQGKKLLNQEKNNSDKNVQEEKKLDKDVEEK